MSKFKFGDIVRHEDGEVGVVSAQWLDEEKEPTVTLVIFESSPIDVCRVPHDELTLVTGRIELYPMHVEPTAEKRICLVYESGQTFSLAYSGFKWEWEYRQAEHHLSSGWVYEFELAQLIKDNTTP